MSNSYFKFKKFTVYQDKCAMKVGTDGVLLGSWTDVSEATNILDIGMGTGLISLMLAQRCCNRVSIDAIDIDEDAFLQTQQNIKISPFDNIICKHTSLQDYVSMAEKRYDIIVSNPPYFSLSLRSPDKQRTLARHTDSLDMKDLFLCSLKLLREKGKLSIVYPYDEKNNLINLAQKLGFYVSRITNAYPTPQSLPKRILLEFSLIKEDIEETNLVIEKERHVYSAEFEALAKDFYLKL